MRNDVNYFYSNLQMLLIVWHSFKENCLLTVQNISKISLLVRQVYAQLVHLYSHYVIIITFFIKQSKLRTLYPDSEVEDSTSIGWDLFKCTGVLPKSHTLQSFLTILHYLPFMAFLFITLIPLTTHS